MIRHLCSLSDKVDLASCTICRTSRCRGHSFSIVLRLLHLHLHRRRHRRCGTEKSFSWIVSDKNFYSTRPQKRLDGFFTIVPMLHFDAGKCDQMTRLLVIVWLLIAAQICAKFIKMSKQVQNFAKENKKTLKVYLRFLKVCPSVEISSNLVAF